MEYRHIPAGAALSDGGWQDSLAHQPRGTSGSCVLHHSPTSQQPTLLAWSTRMSKRSVLAAVPLVLLGILGLFSACSSTELEEALPAVFPEPVEGSRMLFAREAVNLGKVDAGERVQYDFRFRNVGNAPLTITGVTAKVLEGC